MIVDLNLKGKDIVVFGGGREAERKVSALISQNCRIVVIAEESNDAIRRWAEEGKIRLQRRRVENGECLREFADLILTIAATDDPALNRRLALAAGEMRCYVYAVDDPEISDFSHPAVINVRDVVQIAVSTGGRSPLAAGKIRERLEPALKDLIREEDALSILLQEKMRQAARVRIGSSDDRKRFLSDVYRDVEINRLLAEGRLDEAELLAMQRLESFRA
jgi:precorrin-2 dehydrogenase/sirohydrochlorin ferrochelatase